MRVGAEYLGHDRTRFTVWAPFLKELSVKVVSPRERMIRMEKGDSGYWGATADDVPAGSRYQYLIEGSAERPDPASHCQESSVHGPSVVTDHGSFRWNDGGWKGLPLEKMVMYELHVGTFTPEGTFDAVIPRLDDIRSIGINTIEVMPVAQFPGERNWGYDGVYPFAVQNSYGGPEGFRRLVDACHSRGMAVILDVVYNHLGPEGNYLSDFGPYFTEKYQTPWGRAINFDGAYSDGVRNFFIENALFWFREYHVDGLRLDAVHAIFDMSARPFLQELADRVKQFSSLERKACCLVAESDLNDPRVTRPKEIGGFGLDAQWCDDYHHAVHTLLTGEKDGYYADFGLISHLVKSIREGFVYSGEYSEYRKRSHGSSSADRRAEQFVGFSQNHDQVGNRMLGERLSGLVSFEALKLSAGIVVLSPAVPLLFMGEEYGEEAPFLYFVSHSDQDLIRAVREGRKREFRSFVWKSEPPDPQSEETFLRSKLNWNKKDAGSHGVLRAFYKTLLAMRRETPSLSSPGREYTEVWGLEREKVLYMRRWDADSSAFCIFHFGSEDIVMGNPLPAGTWRKVLDSSGSAFQGPGALLPETPGEEHELGMRGHSVAVYLREGSR